MQNQTQWECLPFPALAATQLYALLQLRGAVFVVEQECAYLDPDGLDQAAHHHLCWRGDALVAYQRCLPPGIPYQDDSSIGRIVVAPGARGSQLGRELVERAITFNLAQWPGHDIRIGAQSRLTRFYRSLGFVICSGPYLEDGIEHTEMLRRA
jgi:ElaA protein